MITSRKDLKDILQYEKKQYWGEGRDARYQYLLAFLKDHPNYRVWKYDIYLRKSGYYYSRRKENILYGVMYVFLTP